jgi:hypothetical protein
MPGRRNRQHKPTSSLVGTGAARSVPFEERTNCAICVKNLPARPSGTYFYPIKIIIITFRILKTPEAHPNIIF